MFRSVVSRLSRHARLLIVPAVLAGGVCAPLPAVAEEKATTPAEQAMPAYTELDRENTHEAGKIKLTVFMDFFCSHCHHFDTAVLPVLRKEHGDALEVTYVGYPLVDPQASHIPVLAYYLAEEQGKGEAMRLLLFSAIWDHRLDVTNPGILLGLAQKAGLDLDVFRRDFNANTMQKKLEDGIATGKAIGLRGTPTLLIDNHLKVNNNSLKSLEAVFAEVLGKDT